MKSAIVRKAHTMTDMTPKPLEALKGSIRKWNRIYCKGGVDIGAGNCPLCRLFPGTSCGNCPVHLFSGTGCVNTPYEKWANHHMAAHGGKEPFRVVGKCRSCKKHSKAERDFLASLLPDGEKWR